MSTLSLVFCPTPEKFAAAYTIQHPDVAVRCHHGWDMFDRRGVFKEARHDAVTTGKPVVLFWRQNWDRLEENVIPLVLEREKRRLWAHPGVREADNVWYIARPGQAFTIKGGEPPLDLAS
jgi:hypothetical protein